MRAPLPLSPLLRRSTLLGLASCTLATAALGPAPALAAPPAPAARPVAAPIPAASAAAAADEPRALAVGTLGDGALEVKDPNAGGTTVARVPLTTPALRRGTPQARAVMVAGHRIIEVRVPVRGRPTEEVWIGDGAAKPVRVIWAGLTGPRDADEEVGVAVEVTAERIYEFQTAAHVTRCDGEPVRLFTRAWDFASARFRPIVATPPEPAAQRLTARRDDPAMPIGRPIGGFRFTAASTTAAAGADARSLTAPAALDDGDPRTVWAEGMGGDGRGEFLTARTSAGRARVVGLRIVPGDASTPAAWKARNRVRSAALAFGPEAARRFEIDFSEDPGAARPGTPYWIALPTPIEAACLTVTLRDVYRGTEAAPAGGGGTTALSDLEVFTELDQPAGTERLLADIAAGGACRSRVPLLVALGESAVLPTAQSVLTSKGAGRACLVEALAGIPATLKSVVALDALAAALVGASVDEERLIVQTLQKAGEQSGAALPVRAIAELLMSPQAQPEDRARAARVLGSLDDPGAGRALLGAAGSEPAAVRYAVVQALGTSRQISVAALVAAMNETPARAGDRGQRQADLLRALSVQARRTPADAPAALQALRRALAAPGPFEVRGRAILALGATGDPSVASDLVAVRATSDDPVLRFLATRELAGLGGAPAVAALQEALGDKDPRVREAAAQGLGQHRARGAEDALIRAAKDEPWPFSRRAQVEALGRTCGPAARDLLIRAMERDVDDVRRAAIVGVVRCRDPRARGVVLTTLKARRASATLRELAGSLTGELDPEHRDATLGKDVGDILRSLVNEAEGDLAIEGVAASTLRALGSVRGPDAARTAAALALDARHPYRQLALETLGELCDPGVGAQTLASVRAGADQVLASTARAAEQRCAEGAAAPRPAVERP